MSEKQNPHISHRCAYCKLPVLSPSPLGNSDSCCELQSQSVAGWRRRGLPSATQITGPFAPSSVLRARHWTLSCASHHGLADAGCSASAGPGARVAAHLSGLRLCSCHCCRCVSHQALPGSVSDTCAVALEKVRPVTCSGPLCEQPCPCLHPTKHSYFPPAWGEAVLEGWQLRHGGLFAAVVSHCLCQ